MALIVKSAVRQSLKGMRASEDFFNGLDRRVNEIVNHAIDRAKANDRKTLRAADL